MSTADLPQSFPSDRRSDQITRLLGRTGLLLATAQALFNTVIGGLQIAAGGQLDGEPTPAWVSWSLAAAGIVTLSFVRAAWRGSNRAIWIVSLSRLTEINALLVFVGAFPAGDLDKPFYVLIALIGTTIAGLVLLNPRRR